MLQPKSLMAVADPSGGIGGSGYVPGVCNIGPQEIARRRRAGHIGAALTVAAFAVLVVMDVPPLARFVVAAPAAMAASGYLQAWLRFCAGFGSLGVFNLGPLGATEVIEDPEARRRDRVRSLQIGLASAAFGIAIGAIAVAAPL